MAEYHPRGVTPILNLAFKYALFAIIATSVNLLTQWPVFILFEGPLVLYAAMAAGTVTGLVTKYWLDKRWIFYYTASSRGDDLWRFTLYTLMGGVTTLVFWGTEMVFYFRVPIDGAPYWGAALGLGIGYTLKYLLDRQFVFRSAA